MHAEGDALSGEVIGGILDDHAQAEFERDVAERAALFGDQAQNHLLARTVGQRRYDGRVEIFLEAAGVGESAGRVPLVNILCTEASLGEAFAGLCSGSTHRPDRARSRGRRMGLWGSGWVGVRRCRGHRSIPLIWRSRRWWGGCVGWWLIRRGG